jgi:hypothetical protein
LHPVASHHDAVERQARFGTVPEDEFLDRVLRRSRRDTTLNKAWTHILDKGN